MAKGSQLAQLKSALSQAGITQPPQNKKRKRPIVENGDKDRKAAKLRDIQQKMNPFDVQVTKLKHDVGGRKIKGATGHPAQRKQAGLEQVRADACFPKAVFYHIQPLSSAQKLC
jgi:nucleolar protein 14